MRRSSLFSLVPTALLVARLVQAQDGSISGPGTTRQAAGYSCDPTKCVLPNCACASTSIPGNIPHDETPMFLVFTAYVLMPSERDPASSFTCSLFS